MRMNAKLKALVCLLAVLAPASTLLGQSVGKNPIEGCELAAVDSEHLLHLRELFESRDHLVMVADQRRTTLSSAAKTSSTVT